MRWTSRARPARPARGAPRRGVPDAAIATVTVVALVSGIWLVRSGTEGHPPPQPSAAQADARSEGEAPAAPPLPPSPPDRIRIPAIRVNAPLVGLGLTSSGSLEAPPPERKDVAGWYEAGTKPGETGTAVVAGHVDNADGPAVFYNLGALKRGNTVEMDRRDGSVAVFTVDAVEVYDSRNFPDEKVYGPARRPELRVITCGGGYAKKTGYQGNVVVFAHLTGSR
ncbi:class F sortase [Streptomyces sp. PSKA54]|uniref:Class F sortase n=1 Tax=Streptomyces himalayensis subsp. aureolus TaxID=2758039 RepID=A0A7W2D402_9ACTN|nr:class F sortase [Streptomyces himalayensis]MBA4864320.1 class F sortase [Streptomyces himalayensis subsp. aureolus]